MLLTFKVTDSLGEYRYPAPLTVYVLYNTGRQTVTGERHENLSSALPPWNVVGRTPASDSTKQQHEVVLTNQLLCRGSVTA